MKTPNSSNVYCDSPLTSLCTPGVVSDGGLPAAAADASGGRAAPVEGAGPEVQGGPDGLKPL